MKMKQHRAAIWWRKLRKRTHVCSKDYKPWDSVKTTWIALLLAMNIVLLAVLGVVNGYDAWLSVRTRAGMDSILAQKGILCGSSVYKILETCPEAYTLRMDNNKQDALTNVLLKGTVDTEAKGNVTAWHGDNGTVEWSVSGQVNAHVQLTEVIAPQDVEQAQKVVYDLLNQAGFAVRRDQMETIQNESGYVVAVRQEIGGTELIGCSMQFTIAPENRFTIEGAWCTGTVQPMTIRALESYSAEQVLLTFAQAQETIGQIVSVQPTYVLSDRSGGRFTAIPCWQFTTDNGDYVLNILTGEVADAKNLGVRRDDGADGSFQEELDTWDDSSSDEMAEPSQDDSSETEDIPWNDSSSDEMTEPYQDDSSETADIPWDEQVDMNGGMAY